MISQVTLISVTVEGRQYSLLCDPNSPLDHTKQALFDIAKILGQIEDNARAQQELARQQEEQEKAQQQTPDITPETALEPEHVKPSV